MYLYVHIFSINANMLVRWVCGHFSSFNLMFSIYVSEQGSDKGHLAVAISRHLFSLLALLSLGECSFALIVDGESFCAVALQYDYDCISSCHYYLLFFASTFAPQPWQLYNNLHIEFNLRQMHFKYNSMSQFIAALCHALLLIWSVDHGYWLN